MLSVIVTTFNRCEVLAKCLRSLEEQDLPFSQFEVVIVNDGSTDGTQDFLRTLNFVPHYRVISQANRGLAAARNTGWRAAMHDIVLFLDDDLVCAPQLLSEHLKAHKETDRQLVFGPVLVCPDNSSNLAVRSTRAYYADAIYGPLERGERPAWPRHARVPPNSSIRKHVLDEVGGFDENFVNAHEDIDLGLRLWRHGVRFVYLARAEAEHLFQKTASDLTVEEAQRSGKFEVMLCRKHPAYRRHSFLAGLQETQILSGTLGTSIARSSFANRLASKIATVVRISGISSEQRKRQLLGTSTNLSLQRGVLKACGSWKQFRDEFWRQLPVLMYHGVGDERPGMGRELTVSVGQFSGQMEFLAEHGFTPICPSDWVGWCKEAKPLPEKPIVITFDDAYAELAETALPILYAHHFCATVFVPTYLIGQSNEWDQRRGFSRVAIMDAGTIREWSKKGIEFGGHSRTHPELDLLDQASIEQEVQGSYRDLEILLQKPPTAFAYPYGNYNPAVCSAVRRSFDSGFSTEEGINHLGTDPMRLKRTMVLPQESLPEFASRILFGVNLINHAKAKVRALIESHL